MALSVSNILATVSSQYVDFITHDPVIMWIPNRVAPASFAARYLRKKEKKKKRK